jgi:hypothetical protein
MTRAQLATGAAWLAGWALLTSAAADWSVWRFSAGVLCMSLGGWRLLYVVLRDGLYLLTRDDR